MGASLLIIEDEPSIVDFLVDNLRQDDHRVCTAGSIVDGLKVLATVRPEIALIDVGLPDGSGFDICRRIRAGEAGNPEAGIIMLTARAEEQDRVRGFQRGADDYVVKPFHYPELLGRINALAVRIAGIRPVERLEAGPILVDPSRRAATVAGADLPLPAKEFDLLLALARDPYRVFGKQDLLETVWGYRNSHTTRTLDSHASRLRRRLEDLVPDSRFVINRWGVGYSLLPGA
jgi:DNA-binding response OmpR family regulator